MKKNEKCPRRKRFLVNFECLPSGFLSFLQHNCDRFKDRTICKRSIWTERLLKMPKMLKMLKMYPSYVYKMQFGIFLKNGLFSLRFQFWKTLSPLKLLSTTLRYVLQWFFKNQLRFRISHLICASLTMRTTNILRDSFKFYSLLFLLINCLNFVLNLPPPQLDSSSFYGDFIKNLQPHIFVALTKYITVKLFKSIGYSSWNFVVISATHFFHFQINNFHFTLLLLPLERCNATL